jgi:hypothetical protein
MRRRATPYSRQAEIRASRGELLALILTTLGLGLIVNLLSNILNEAWLKPLGRFGLLVFLVVVALALTLVAAWLLYNHAESQVVRIEVWLPYFVPGGPGVRLERRSHYRPLSDALRAWPRCYPRDSSQARDWLARYQKAHQTQAADLVAFVRDDHIALSQYLVLYALQRASDWLLSAVAPYSWLKVDLPSVPLDVTALPELLRENRFLQVDPARDTWQMLLPRDVSFTLSARPESPWPVWALRHRLYGEVEISWLPGITPTGRESQVWHYFESHLPLNAQPDACILSARLKAQARLRWTLLSGSEAFHSWVTNLLSLLEEALDWAYFQETHRAQILDNLDWRLGYWKRGDSVLAALARIERRLDDLAQPSTGKDRSQNT